MRLNDVYCNFTDDAEVSIRYGKAVKFSVTTFTACFPGRLVIAFFCVSNTDEPSSQVYCFIDSTTCTNV